MSDGPAPDPYPFASVEDIRDQPKPADADAKGMTQRRVRHVATGVTFLMWCPPPWPKLAYDDAPAVPAPMLDNPG